MAGAILCFDIGGTSIRAATAVNGARPGKVDRFATPATDREAFLARISAIAEAQPERPAAIAISLAGIVNPQTGRLVVANIPAIHGTELKTDLEARMDMPVIIANDADCFAVAEAVFGAGRGHDIVFGVIFGTGVGGGLVSGKHLINKAGGFAGEWGHGPVVPLAAGGRPIPHFACGCGVSGCVDTIAGGPGLERLHTFLHGEALSAPDILSGWHAGRREPTLTVKTCLELLSGPLAMAINLTGATIVPAGGGLARDHAFVAAIDEAVRPLTLARQRHPLVVPAASGGEPGLAGAAAIGFQTLAADPD
ncbi:ROK family protein [Martelella radicis]|uniref:N-acetylglucosamine kinase n=1 Tax=Martelella radicis TaxID=1397476 RepID=A0A7W6PB23_9HYPH|nr:ROK family protein [Martelella radicis]MBB4122007.1 N-acetylglucosamine kinase [Martelella radicis]